MWIYLDREGRHAYDFSDSRKSERPRTILGGYRGAIHADAYPGYDQLFTPEGATGVACWVHTRRKFLDAESSESKLAGEAIGRIRELYAVEGMAKERELDDEGEVVWFHDRGYSAGVLLELLEAAAPFASGR